MCELVLRLEGVDRWYRRGRDRWKVLSGVSLTVAQGQFVGVLGGRGEGKTTLVEVAAGLKVPDAGAVWFEDRDLAVCSDEERTELLGDRIAWMPRADMADFDVLRYVALPLAMGRGGMRAAEDRAMEALRRVGVDGCADRSWRELSDWDRLLVTFARGYAVHPSLLVVDDLLDALGPGGTREAGELLLSLARELQCGVLVAASDMSALLVAHRVLCFDGDGGISLMAESDHPTTNIDPTNLVDFPGAAEVG
jgi:putative ABC transport system ATP-binding protein